MARGGGYCCQCTIEILFCALLSISLIAVLFFVCLIFFNKDFHHPDTFKTLCISAVWHFSGVFVSILGLYGLWMKKSALLTLGCCYFYLNGIQMGFYSVTVILIKNPAWKKIVSYNEPVFLNMVLKTMLGDKRLIMTISYLISTLASFYFALIVRSHRENLLKKKNRLASYQYIFEVDKFQNSQIIDCHFHMREYFKCVRKIGMEILFFGLLGLFWIAVISLGYIAVYHPQDFAIIKPFEPGERYPFIHKSDKSPECEHYEYFADFQHDKPLQNIWITLIWSIVGVVVSLSTLYGIMMESPYWLDSGAYYLFVYTIHKAFVAGILFVIKCPGTFLFRFFVLTEPLVALLHILDVAVSVKLIHLILMAVAIFLLVLMTKLRESIVKKNLKKRYESMQMKVFQSNMRYFDPVLVE